MRSVFVGGEGWVRGGRLVRSSDRDGLWEEREARRAENDGDDGTDCGETEPVILAIL